MERLRKAAQLSLADWRVLAQAWILFWISDLKLRIPPFRLMLALPDIATARESDHPLAASVLARYAWLVSVAGRYSLVRSTCLKEALVLSSLLERRGIMTQLRIGVARQDGRFKAHAWLERNGQTIPGMPGPDGYEPLVPHQEEMRAS